MALSLCDFCSSPAPACRYPAVTFTDLAWSRSIADWLACDERHALIEASERDALAARSMTTCSGQMAVGAMGRQAPFEYCRELHARFWRARRGGRSTSRREGRVAGSRSGVPSFRIAEDSAPITNSPGPPFPLLRDTLGMRTSDLARLDAPYTGNDDSRRPEPTAALGVEIPSWRDLESIILGDLTPHAPYGVAWWAPHPGTSRRILISDQLYACAVSVSGNMVEAGLHWLEFLDYSARESDRLADAVQIQNGRLAMVAPRPRSPLEELLSQLERMHILGVVRAVSGALDCLAGTIIGVVALPTSILRADLNIVRKRLREIKDTSMDAGT